MKGATFSSPKSPSANDDPVLNVASVPARTLTSPQCLADIVSAADARVAGLIESIEKNLNLSSVTSLDDKDVCPVPQFLLRHAAFDSDPMDIVGDLCHPQQKGKETATNHEHASDSGLGTSVSGDSNVDANPMRQCRFCDSSDPGHADLHEAQRASERSVYQQNLTPHRRLNGPQTTLPLSNHAIQKIKEFIVDPILAEEKLKDYHGLIEELPQRIGDRYITCLRDLEKTLIYCAPVSTILAPGDYALAHAFFSYAKAKAKSAAAYLNFAETSIQCIHTTVDHLHEREQRRPTDRPYTNNYFLDLVQQVRQYARIMAISRQKQREGKPMSKEDWTPWVAPCSVDKLSNDVLINLFSGEKLRLKGGLAHNGSPSELVRDKPDGETLAIDAGKRKLSVEGFGDDAEASMARKRKCDIGKIDWRQCQECKKWFKRPCDLTKHEKTHTRPWKCPNEGCKYHEMGWPTEKERDRHINDKHTSAPALYKCKFPGCSYTSKRESNCKQHMEKTHGYEYKRSKTRKGDHLTPVASTPQTEQGQFSIPTPNSGSAFQPLSTPSTTYQPSPLTSSENAFSPAGTVDTNLTNGISPTSNIDLHGMDGNNDMFGQDCALFNDNTMIGDFSTANNNMNLFNPTPPMNALGGEYDFMSNECMPMNNPSTFDLTPPLTDFSGDRRPSDFSGLDGSISNEDWTDGFNFGDANVNNPWPDVNNFFPQYSPEDPFTEFSAVDQAGESSAMAQTLFGDSLVRGEGAGNMEF